MTPIARVHPQANQAAVPAPAALYGQELDDGDLEQVVGGLERVYIPGMTIAQG
jgi:hypothetical protein